MEVAPSCPTLCNPVDFTIHGTLLARILEWVAFPFPRGSSQPRDWTQVSRIAGGFFTNWATGKYQDSTRTKIYLFTADGCLHTFKVAHYKYSRALVFWWTYACIPVGCVPRGGITGPLPSPYWVIGISICRALGDTAKSLLAIWISSFLKWLFRSVAHFLQGCLLLRKIQKFFIYIVDESFTDSFIIDIFLFGLHFHIADVFWWAEVLNYNII